MSVTTTTSVSSACGICRKPLRAGGTGRPPKFCGTGCKRAAEFAIRRLTHRLQTVEALASEARLDGALDRVDRGRAAEQEKACLEELERLQTRLVKLLDDGEGPVG